MFKGEEFERGQRGDGEHRKVVNLVVGEIMKELEGGVPPDAERITKIVEKALDQEGQEN